MQKGFVPILVVSAILATVAVVIVGVSVYRNNDRSGCISQDASFGCLPYSPSLLETSLQNVFPQPSTATDETANWETYIDSGKRFNFKYPDTFKLEMKEGSISSVYISKDMSVRPGGFGGGDILQSGTVITFIVYPHKDLSEKSLMSEFGAQITVKEIVLDNRRGREIVFPKTDNEKHGKKIFFELENKEVIGIDFAIAYDVKNEDSYQEYLKDFNQILSTFKFLDQKQVKLFYYNSKYDPNQECVVGEESFVQRSVSDGQSIIEDTINLLINGGLSETERSEGFSTEFPKQEFKLLNTTLDNGVLTLEFSEVPGFTSGGACRVGLLSSQIIKTAMQFPEVKDVKFKPETLFQP